MAEEERFEPSLAFTTTNGLANRPLQPLGYSSRAVWIVRRLTHTEGHTGGSDGVRTHDPLLARQVLSQLSYTPSIYIIIDIQLIVKPLD